MDYQVIMDDLTREEWEKAAREFSDYSVYQTWSYQQVRSEAAGQKISRALVKNEKGEVVTMCQLRIKPIKLCGLRVGYVQWGPLLNRKDGTDSCSVEALRALRNSYLDKIVNVMRMVPNVCEGDRGQKLSSRLESAGFTYLSKIKSYRTFILPVHDSEENIRKRLRKSYRRDLKYAEKRNIELKEGEDSEFSDILKRLYLESIQRKNFSGLDPEEFIQPQQILCPEEKMKILIAYCEAEPVSVLLISNLGNTGLVLLAANNEKGLKCGASYLVWYEGALTAWRAGMQWYDQGGIDPEKNPNGYQFKSRMGGEEICFIGAFEACSSPWVKNVWRAAERSYRLIKK